MTDTYITYKPISNEEDIKYTNLELFHGNYLCIKRIDTDKHEKRIIIDIKNELNSLIISLKLILEKIKIIFNDITKSKFMVDTQYENYCEENDIFEGCKNERSMYNTLLFSVIENYILKFNRIKSFEINEYKKHFDYITNIIEEKYITYFIDNTNIDNTNNTNDILIQNISKLFTEIDNNCNDITKYISTL